MASYIVGIEPIDLISVNSYFGLAAKGGANIYGLVAPLLMSSLSVTNYFFY